MVIANLKSCSKINDDDGYNAFTDLKCINGKIYVAYRSGKAHVSPSGKIILCKSIDGGSWEIIGRLEKEGLDCRDPRLSVLDGKLYLLFFTLNHHHPNYPDFKAADSFIYEVKADDSLELVCTLSYDDLQSTFWSLGKLDEDYLIIGYNYKYGHYESRLFTSNQISGPWELVSQINDDNIPPDAGINEVDLVVNKDKSITCFCRIDGDRFSRIAKDSKIHEKANKLQKERINNSNLNPIKGDFCDWIGVAKSIPPYTRWDMDTHRLWLKGPRSIKYRDGYLVCGRFAKKGWSFKQINLYWYDGEFHELLELDGGRDGSYAGLAWNPNEKNEMLISFYSDHDRFGKPFAGKANDIWFARVEIDTPS